MASSSWRKIENEAGYPCYVDDTTGKHEYDHPQFMQILETIKEYNNIKYSTYRIAFKVFAVQRYFTVPPLCVSSGVFARHQLSLPENSLSLDIAELEAVLADIYFAAEKKGLFTGDVDLMVDLLINLLLNVYDKDRKEPMRVLAAKTLLIILSEESVAQKWLALANSCVDHNGCVSPRRLTTLLSYLMAVPQYFGDPCEQLQSDVDSCFDKSSGMLGVSARTVAEWGVHHCVSARWLSVLQRICHSRNNINAIGNCSACIQPLIQVLKFKCAKCNEVYFCEKCYLYDKDLMSVAGHKRTHLVHEIIDGEMRPSQSLGLIKSIRRFFFCTKTKKKKVTKKNSKKIAEKGATDSLTKRKKDDKHFFTSTVGKASGNSANNPICVLQDIILQLETQNKALKDLSTQLQNAAQDSDNELKLRVDVHWTQITKQINRLKILKENLAVTTEEVPSEVAEVDKDKRRVFDDEFSPILVMDDKQSKVTDKMKNQPRVLSLDSGNFSVSSKQPESPKLLTVSGDALKPIVVHTTSDSISTVSMNDISSWYNESDSLPRDKRNRQSVNSKMRLKKGEGSHSLSATEQRFAADIRSVETSNDKMRELNADLDTVLDRLQQILTNNFAMDDSSFDNTQLRETANEMEGLLGTLIRGVEQRATLNATKG